MLINILVIADNIKLIDEITRIVPKPNVPYKAAASSGASKFPIFNTMLLVAFASSNSSFVIMLGNTAEIEE